MELTTAWSVANIRRSVFLKHPPFPAGLAGRQNTVAYMNLESRVTYELTAKSTHALQKVP
jgi:hypothetical protein